MSKLYQSELPIFFTPPPVNGRYGSLHKDAPAPPPTDPKMYEIMDTQIKMSKDALDFTRQAYSQNLERQKGIDAMTKTQSDSMLQDAALNRQRSQEQYDYYMNKGRPVIDQTLKDATTYDSAENIGAAKGRAAADVNQQYGQAEDQMTRSLSRMGVMPNASRMATINSNLAIQKAASSAGAMNNAEVGVRNQALNMRAGASNMVNGMQNTSLQMNNAALQDTGSALSATNAANNGYMQAQGQMVNGMQGAGNILNSAANTGNTIQNQKLNVWNGQVAQTNADNAGYGSLAGMALMSLAMADGGKIDGPGTGVSDSVDAVNQSNGQPIRVSNGEFIIPADVVRAKGEEFFNKLVERHHTPAAIQRRTRRS